MKIYMGNGQIQKKKKQKKNRGKRCVSAAGQMKMKMRKVRENTPKGKQRKLYTAEPKNWFCSRRDGGITNKKVK